MSRVKEFIEGLPSKLMEEPDMISDMNCVYQFNVDGEEGGRWFVSFDNGQVSLDEGGADDPDCVITMKDMDFLELIQGSLAPQMAFMMGKLKVGGNMGLALKLGTFLKP